MSLYTFMFSVCVKCVYVHLHIICVCIISSPHTTAFVKCVRLLLHSMHLQSKNPKMSIMSICVTPKHNIIKHPAPTVSQGCTWLYKYIKKCNVLLTMSSASTEGWPHGIDPLEGSLSSTFIFTRWGTCSGNSTSSYFIPNISTTTLASSPFPTSFILLGFPHFLFVFILDVLSPCVWLPLSSPVYHYLLPYKCLFPSSVSMSDCLHHLWVAL